MKEKLKDIVKFYSGLIISREKTSLQSKVHYDVLNYKSLADYVNIDLNKLEKVYTKEDVNIKYITKKNDIILKLVYPFKAILISEKESGILITSNFCKIICSDKVLPEYLIACLNSEKIDKKLKVESKNQSVNQISIKDLENVEIELYDIQKQKIIARLYNDYLKKIQLTKKILEKEQKIIKNIYK